MGRTWPRGILPRSEPPGGGPAGADRRHDGAPPTTGTAPKEREVDLSCAKAPLALEHPTHAPALALSLILDPRTRGAPRPERRRPLRGAPQAAPGAAAKLGGEVDHRPEQGETSAGRRQGAPIASAGHGGHRRCDGPLPPPSSKRSANEISVVVSMGTRAYWELGDFANAEKWFRKAYRDGAPPASRRVSLPGAAALSSRARDSSDAEEGSSRSSRRPEVAIRARGPRLRRSMNLAKIYAGRGEVPEGRPDVLQGRLRQPPQRGDRATWRGSDGRFMAVSLQGRPTCGWVRGRSTKRSHFIRFAPDIPGVSDGQLAQGSGPPSPRARARGRAWRATLGLPLPGAPSRSTSSSRRRCAPTGLSDMSR